MENLQSPTQHYGSIRYEHTVLSQNIYPCINQRSQREEQLHSQVNVMHGGGCWSDQSRQSNIGHSFTLTHQVSTNQNTVSSHINQSHHVISILTILGSLWAASESHSVWDRRNHSQVHSTLTSTLKKICKFVFNECSTTAVYLRNKTYI